MAKKGMGELWLCKDCDKTFILGTDAELHNQETGHTCIEDGVEGPVCSE